jgi:hypothetical protein
MAHSLLNTSPVLRGRVTLPRQGVWHADLVLEAESAPTGAVTLRLGAALSLRGVVQQAGVFAGQVRVRVVGGAGLLATELEPRWYVGAPRELPLRDLVEEAGERLSSTCDPALLGEVLEGWTRVRGTAAAALARLLDGTGASWRLLPDGTLWAGPETWPQAQGMPDLLVLEEDRTAGRLLLATEAPQLLPGQTLRGDRVSDVEITIEPEQLRLEALLERSTPGVGDRLKGAFLALVEQLIRRRTDYLGSYLGTVVATGSGGRLEVKLDDAARPPVTSVVLRAGLPGTELKLLDGCRVLVSWQGGSPRFPIAQPWDEGGLKESRTTASEKITLNAPQVILDETGRKVARIGDLVAVGGPTTFVQLVPLPGNTAPSVVPGVPYQMLFLSTASPVPQPQLYGSIVSAGRVKG